MTAHLGIFLLSHNRPQLIRETIDSLLAQDYKNFELIISENSSDESVLKALKPYSADPRVIIVPRRPHLASLQHFEIVLKEALNYNYAALFHDDDVLRPMAVTQMMSHLEAQPNLTAVACNAIFIKGHETTDQVFAPSLTNDIQIKNSRQLIHRYIFKFLGHPPFPAYIYRTKFLKDLNLNLSDGGKYSDTSFLVKLIQRGPFYWIAEPYMGYRQHSHNDSANLNLKDMTLLNLFFIKKHPEMLLQIGFYFSKQLLKKVITFFRKSR